MNDLIAKYYDEEISKEQFVAEFSKSFDDSEFVSFMQRNIEFGSIENLEDGIKEYKKVTSIDVAVKVVLGKKVAAKKEVSEKRVVVKSDNKKETKINKSLLMKRAWEIARQGQAQFGGKVRSYFAEALKMAWAEVK